tara:strand:+ start:1440 stop:1682 length:243 start_codon:yes stop_codon:yes gene_type:complete
VGERSCRLVITADRHERGNKGCPEAFEEQILIVTGISFFCNIFVHFRTWIILVIFERVPRKRLIDQVHIINSDPELKNGI